MVSLFWIFVLALLLATLVVGGWRAFDGSFGVHDGFLMTWLPRILMVILVACVLYLTWR